jgi:ADP-heptose:LPS heptosyltransferase
MLNRATLPMRGLEVVALLDDGVAEALEISRRLHHVHERAFDLAGETSLPQLAAVLEAADLMLSNDSGPMHLAAALGTSVVGVFTCTSPVISGPAGSGHELVATGVSCAASYRKRCPHAGPAHQACLEEISVERVRQAVARAASRQTPKRRSA